MMKYTHEEENGYCEDFFPMIERKVNIGSMHNGVIDKNILVRGAFLCKRGLGKPPMPINQRFGGA